MITQFMLRQRPVSQLLICALLVATIYVAATFRLDFLLGTSSFWNNPQGPWLNDPGDLTNNADMLGAIAGYFTYAQGPWRLPLFLVPALAPPAGTSGIYLDFVPIVALPGKLLTIATGRLINPYGVWIGFAFLANAVAATWLVALAGQRNLLAMLLASVLALSAPPLLHRFGHLALLGQFVLILALALYLRAPRMRPRAAAWGWIGVLGLSLLVAVYLFVIGGLIYAASWLDRAVLRPAATRVRYGEPALVGTVLLALMLLAGHIGAGTSSPFSKGFGMYSMNLAAPFWPQRSGLFPGYWPIIDATGGQYEGFAYFGAGALLLIAVAIGLGWRHIGRFAATHRGFAAVALGLTLFALSDRIYLFDKLVLDYSFSWRLDYALGIFRSSGRFFWPVFYAAALGAVVLVLRSPHPRSVVALGLTVCGLQLVDTEPLRARLAALAIRDVAWTLPRAEWVPRITAASEVFVMPSFSCAGGAGVDINMDIAFMTAQANRPTNTVYNARATLNCLAEANAAINGPWRADTLYIYLSGYPFSAPDGYMAPGQYCERFAQGSWCRGSGR